jgi:tRNA threonylcarbamoyladenosine biosynthesis protein TsaB
MTGYILGIDTSSSLGLCFIASSKDQVLDFKYIDAKSSHAELIFSAIQEVLNNTGIKIREVSTVVYTAGPGSFTGLRIAYSAVRGFLMAEPKISAHGVSALKALIYNLSDLNNTSSKRTKKFSLISGSKNELYVYAKDENDKILIEEKLFDIDDFVSLLCKMPGEKTFIGSGSLEYKDKLLCIDGAIVPDSERDCVPSPHVQDCDNYHIIKPEGILSLLDEKPIDGINYLKASYAETNLQKKVKVFGV